MGVTAKLALQVYQRDNYTCVYCGSSGRTFEGWECLTIDHFNPNGGDHLENLVTACFPCNNCKNKQVWATRDEATTAIQRWKKERRDYWETHIRPTIRN